ncbi:amidohydrolase family protein [Micromonospora aurantiaca]|uniref:amidohydrolase family protein n=1 Tax=Micromonospora aurantiaca (nom. illeg.) TaxID=47850 RepID=UPI0037B64295
MAQLRAHLPRLLAAGLTGIHDLDGQDARAAYETLYARGELPLRVHKTIPATALDEAIDAGWATGDGDRWLSTGPVKIFTDGALGSHTCLMTEPYDGEPGNHGIAVTPAEEFERLVATAAGAGMRWRRTPSATRRTGWCCGRTRAGASRPARARWRGCGTGSSTPSTCCRTTCRCSPATA